MSFRFLNPRMVDELPWRTDGVCYHGIGDKPDILCGELPPNQWRFLGYWYLSPERHFQEWIGFLLVGVIVLFVLGPKIKLKYPPLTSGSTNALKPRLWMILSTLIFYPYVAYTKLSWEGSYYPGRWMMFVGMPVGTLWIISVLFCCSMVSSESHGGSNRRCENGGNLLCKVRYWLLETWFSFLPLLADLLPVLFHGAVHSAWRYTHGKAPRGGHDGENAEISYFCHGLYLVLAPVYYFWIGELSLDLTSTTTSSPIATSSGNMDLPAYTPYKPAFQTYVSGGHSRHSDLRIHSTIASRWILCPNTSTGKLWNLIVDSALKQGVGTAICVLYYMGIITPASIVAGLNVNFLLMGDEDGPNFRIFYAAGWFYRGFAFRLFLGAAKLAWETSQKQYRKRRQ